MALLHYLRGMARERISTTVDGELLGSAPSLTDAAYRMYDERSR